MMKLFFSPSSPFVRKVTVTAIELGVAEQIERITVNPWEPKEELVSINPLSKVPALITERGEMLYDSPVICEYLDGDHRLLPASGELRWQILRLQALADGILDAAVLRRMESMRPEGERSDKWMNFQRDTVSRALASLEQEAQQWDETLNLGRITTACALGYLDFRFADEDWRTSHPALAKWFSIIAGRDSMQQTIPQG